MPGTPFETRALDDVSLTIHDGEFVGVIGHTGSGKSTLIAHMNALMRPEVGHVLVGGVDVGEKNQSLIEIRREVGLVFQYPEYQLFEETWKKTWPLGRKISDCRKRRSPSACGTLRAGRPFGRSAGKIAL